MASNLITKKRTRMASETIKYVICLRDWGLVPEAEDEEEVEVIDLSDDEDDGVRELMVNIPNLTLDERLAEEAKKREDREADEAIRLVNGLITMEAWEKGHQRKLARRQEAVEQARKALRDGKLDG